MWYKYPTIFLSISKIIVKGYVILIVIFILAFISSYRVLTYKMRLLFL